MMTNAVYDVYARMSGSAIRRPCFWNVWPTLPAHLESAAGGAGTFVSPDTGGPQNWTFVQLKDFFSNPCRLRFPGTNTFRATSLADDGLQLQLSDPCAFDQRGYPASVSRGRVPVLGRE